MTGKICAYGFDLGPAQQEALKAGDLTGALGQQPFLQGFWPVMQLYLRDRPRHLGGQPRHARSARDQGHRSATSASASRTSVTASGWTMTVSREGRMLPRDCFV